MKRTGEVTWRQRIARKSSSVFRVAPVMVEMTGRCTGWKFSFASFFARIGVAAATNGE